MSSRELTAQIVLDLEAPFRPKPGDIRTYPPGSGQCGASTDSRDLQGFRDVKYPRATSLKIVVSPVRFRPSPFCEGVVGISQGITRWSWWREPMPSLA